jgi:CRP-like cAMP-binding protein
MFAHDLDAITLRRVLALRQTAFLADVELAELATLARNATEAVLPTGTRVAVAGDRVAAVHVVLDGQLARRGGEPFTWSRHDVFGSLLVLADLPARFDVGAAVPTRTLEIASDDLRDVLDDNFGVLVAALRGVARRLVALGGGTPAPALPPITGPLGLVERVLLLRRQPAFARASVRALASLAQTATEQEWRAGAILAHRGELATEAWIVTSGELAAGERRFGPGAAVGLVETLAASEHGAPYEAITPVRTLSVTGAAILDVLEDHTDLALGVVSALSRDLLERGAS